MLLNPFSLMRGGARVAVAVLMGVALTTALSACGQQGALFIPTEPAAANRATLPETLRSGMRIAPAASASPASTASSPSAPQ